MKSQKFDMRIVIMWNTVELVQKKYSRSNSKILLHLVVLRQVTAYCISPV